MSEHTSHRRRWYGLLFICMSLLIISLDNTVLNVALPAISRGLGASASELQWIVDAYILVFAALLLTAGAVGDRMGRKRTLQVGVVWFGVFSLLAAVSSSTNMLIVARALLGVGGALIMPSTLSLITSMFRDPKERAQAIGIWAGVFGLGVGLGPLVGGWLLEHYDWNAVFFINLPVVAVALLGGQVFLTESRDENAPAPDIPGVVLSIGGLFALVYAIIEAGVDGWGASNVLTGFGIAGVLLVIFFWWESRAPNAMLPLYLFRNMSFTGANVAITLMMFGLFGSLFFMSQFLQSVQGYTALETGIRLFPMSLIIMISAGISSQVAGRIGTKLAVGLGFLVAAAGMYFLAYQTSVGSSYETILFGLGVIGFGMGSAMSPATDSIMGSVPVSKAGIGSAMNDTTREIGGALGVAILGTLMNDVYLEKVAGLDGTVPPPAYEAISSSIQGAHAVAAQIGGQGADLILGVADRAFVSGMTEAMLIGAIIMTVAGLFSLTVLPREPRCIEPECQDDVDLVEADAVAVAGVAGD